MWRGPVGLGANLTLQLIFVKIIAYLKWFLIKITFRLSLHLKQKNIIKFNNIPDIVDKKDIIRFISNFVLDEGYRIKKIEYNFVSKNKILNLNKKYLKHNTETDIITFDYSKSKKIQAEMYLCFSVIERNAKDNMQSVENEIVRVISHGLLHCMGYNDKNNTDRDLMRKKEDSFLKMFHVKQFNNVWK